MPTAAEFIKQIRMQNPDLFVVDPSSRSSQTVIQFEGWKIDFKPASSGPTLLNFRFAHRHDVSLYIYLRDGELGAIMGTPLRELLAVAAQRAEPDHPNVHERRLVDLRRDDDTVKAILDDEERLSKIKSHILFCGIPLTCPPRSEMAITSGETSMRLKRVATNKPSFMIFQYLRNNYPCGRAATRKLPTRASPQLRTLHAEDFPSAARLATKRIMALYSES